jgi:hypothetical protein
MYVGELTVLLEQDAGREQDNRTEKDNNDCKERFPHMRREVRDFS